MPEITLTGCAPVPLAHYLKALGVLNVLTKHSDRPVSCAWKQGVFQVESTFSESSIMDFFLNDYVPSPIVVPWSGNDFFAVDRDAKCSVFEKPPTSAKVIEAVLATDSSRLAEYRDTIQKVFTAMDVSGAASKKSIEGSGAEQKLTKTLFLQALRNCLPETAVEWIDSAAVIEQRACYFNALLGGGGGSDGNSHFSDNYMQCLWMVFSDFEIQRKKAIMAVGGTPFDSRSALAESLFGGEFRGTQIAGLSPVLFDSTRVGGPNQTSGFQADSGSNPWNFILMLEGSLLFAGALGRKLDDDRAPSARFPFLFDASPVGLGASFFGESAGREIWLPLWTKFTGLREIRALLSEGRIEKHGRMAKRGTDAFVGTAQLGFDRGIDAFQRTGFFKGRIGGDNYFTAVDQGLIVPRFNKTINLLQDFDNSLDILINAAKGSLCPDSVHRQVIELDNAVATYAMARGVRKDRLRDVLISLGRMEQALSHSFKWTKKADLHPLHGLREQWLTEADDGSAEFRLAVSLAGMRAWLGKEMLYFRQHLEPVTVRTGKERSWVNWADAPDNDVVWHEGDLIGVLNAILARRVVRVQQAGVDGWPDWSPRAAKLEDITAFIEGRINDELLADLIWGLALVDWDKIISKEKPEKATREPDESPDSEKIHRIVPSSFYALLRLCFRGAKEKDEAIPLVPAILQRAMNGDGEAASQLASRRLQGSGKRPLVTHLPVNGDVARRTAAAMLFPISPGDFHLLEKVILHQPTNPTL